MSALAEVVRASDPELAAYAVPAPPPGRFEERVPDRERAFVIEAVWEGFQLHYGEPRAFSGMDDDLRLLAGDALYALGLERLARNGDLEAVVELSDVISLSAQAQADGRPELVELLWDASAALLAGEDGGGARAALERA